MHFYEFDIKLYHSRTEHLTETEDLAYRRLIDLYYLNELPFINDLPALARLIRMRTHTDSIEGVLKEFFVLLEDGWHHEHADSVLAKIYSKSIKATDSANRRWAKHYKELGIKNPSKSKGKKAMRTHSEGIAKALLLTTYDLQLKYKAPKVVLDLKGLLELVPNLTTEVAETFLDVRKRQRAPLTKLALTHLEAEAKKAGITTVEAITMAAVNSWRSFKADWVKAPTVITAKSKVWFLTVEGIDAKAKELGIVQGGDQYQVYRNHVLTTAGVKPDEYKEAKKSLFNACI